MKIKQIDSSKSFDAFVAAQSKAQFNQSWDWGVFQSVTGPSVSRFFIEDDGIIVASANIIMKPLISGKKYFYCPRGPVFVDGLPEEKKREVEKSFIAEMAREAGKASAVFLRFEPRDKFFPGESAIRQTIDVQPKNSLLLDLTKTEEGLLAEMHQKTRYNIRLAEKRGVKVVEYGIDKFDIFWKLMSETTDRDGFRAHGADYYQKMLESLSGEIGNKEKLVMKLFVAEMDGRPLAALLAAFYGDTATYVHGASSNTERQLMAPFLLQWETIKRARSAGYGYYDFYGVDESKWPGVTRFKRGFGGSDDIWPGTFDVVFSVLWYNMYYGLRRLRRLIKIF